MTKINDLNTKDEIKDSDKFVIWDGSTRAVTAETLADYVADEIVADFQPKDATLTAIAALINSAGDYIEATGVDTFRTRKLTVATYAALTVIPGTDRHDDMLVYVSSRTTDNDGGEGWWRFDAGSSATANGGTILAPDVGPGRWIRQYQGAIVAEWFGFGAANAAATNLAALNAALSAGASAVTTKNVGPYQMTGTVSIPPNCALVGQHPHSQLVWGAGSAPSNLTNYAAITLAGDNSEICNIDLTLSTAGDYRRVVSGGGFNNQKCLGNKISLALTGVTASQTYTIFFASASAYTGCIVEYNEITGTCNVPVDGVQMSNNRNGSVSHNYIHDITATGATKFYWGIYTASECYGTRVNYNRIHDVSLGGIHLNNTTPGSSFDFGRQCSFNDIRNVLFVGISIDGVQNTIAHGNTVVGADLPVAFVLAIGCEWSGGFLSTVNDPGVPISLDLPIFEVTGNNNIIRGVVFGDANDALYAVSSTGTGTLVADCVLTAASSAEGIRLAGARSRVQNCILEAPTITTAAARIRISATNCSAVGNTVFCSATGQMGIRTASSNTLISQNRVNGGTHCIWADGSSSAATITDNVVSGSSSTAIANTGTGNRIYSNTGHADAGTTTIVSGAIVAQQGLKYLRVDTEAAAASDDLDTVTYSGQSGDVLVLAAFSGARDVVAKDGTGNLILAGDFTMDNSQDSLMLMFDGTNWLELSRSDNAA